ncbi:glycoside hydrolase [Sphingobium sufflavum]|uniref:glycosyl hydrolase n=1 Tax=Sphingobium sufflavum TaxID=1129547 RepID=UPI001F1AB606|nr:glycosyl hydrolase [Sphingobium sufflavum]MCE7797086.1 glycoside hydrolase [Sphingobium sufflavum]
MTAEDGFATLPNTARQGRRHPRLSRLARLLWTTGLMTLPLSATANPTLGEQFRNPPQSARPRVWWHWLNGNITRDGITKDLAWMKRTGIGGVQTFDINFSTPTVVKDRLLYMTPPWKEAFRFAAQEADRLGLEMTIAASPGWSETGGPWVRPTDGMKKLVWSSTDVSAAHHFDGRLAAPPAITGPYQDLPLVPEPGAKAEAPPHYYADVAVLAYPVATARALPVPRITATDGTALDAGTLTDGQFTAAITLPKGAEPTVLISYDKPQTVRALTLFGNGNSDLFNGASVTATLEARNGGADWRPIATFLPSLVPTTVSFAPVTARDYRLRLTPRTNQSPIDRASAPGYAGVNYAALLGNRPTQFAELRLLGEARVNQFEEKAGFAVARDYDALDGSAGLTDAGVMPSKVIDLTGRLRADGTLDWKVPSGTWRIVRFGYSLIGKTNHPAPQEATGLEVDKMDGAAVRAYMTHYLATYRDTVGPELLGARGINAVLTDSTEVGSFNWTPKMMEQFHRLRGYDPLPWLPALTGEIIGSRDQSDRFLYDFRRTVADLHASEHYGTVAAVAHENGLKVYGEALEGWRVSLGDDMDMRRHTDVPMAAMWTFPRETGPRPLLIADLRTAAATAHLLGKPFVAAESMTSSRYPWAHGPADLRRIVDTEFVHGVNRIVIHTSPHQPVDDKQPGLSLRHIGQFFTRHESWADMAAPWIDYIARSSLMLQQGRNVADVAYFLGEEAPAGAQAMDGYFPDVPVHNGYDLINASAVTDLLRVDKGDLISSGGARYRLLYLSGTSARMTLPVLTKIAQLAEQGATIVGNAPSSSPSLADDPKLFDALVRRLWSGQPVTQIGTGRVIAGKDLPSALRQIGVAPDFVATAAAGADGSSAAAVDFVHRGLDDGDIYFLRNPASSPTSVEARFRVSGRVPELWKADTGESRPLSYRIEGGQTIVPINFDAEDSAFVVFRTKAEKPSHVVPERHLAPAASLDGPWTVAFQPGRGAPATLTLPALAPLNDNVLPGVRYFSGVATYRTSFAAPKRKAAGSSLILDLGQVGDLAEVSINGHPVGTVWHAPYRIDIGGHVKPGTNKVEVRVANLWVNRLIGDAHPGADKIGWTAGPMYRADAPLRPSGLIGPVRLMQDAK